MKSMSVELNSVSFSYRDYSSASRSIKFDLLTRKRKPLREKLAIDEIDFSIERGEIVGVIGRNGAGKSTLTKLLMGIIYPTRGRVITVGNTVGMLQLGSGLNLDLTGRENIRLTNLIKGGGRLREGEIVEFVSTWAGLEEAINDPLRTFSSGMLARFSFAIETFSVPDILIIDEVLSVGDLDFQAKSASRIKELIKSGATVVIVTHDLEVVRNQCTRCLWLENGSIRKDGFPIEVVADYLKSQ